MMFLVEFFSDLWLFFVIGFLSVSIAGFAIPKRLKRIKMELPVSVIIAAWNEEKRIRFAIDSVLNQNYPKRKFEVIVSGGGEDGTAEVCREYESKGLIRYLFEKKRSGKWFALNRALKISRNGLIAFLDADCTVDRNWLRNLVSEIGDSDMIISRPDSLSSKMFSSKMLSIFYPFLVFHMENMSKFFKIPNFFGFGSLMKKKVLRQVKFKKSLVEDWRFSLDMLRKKYNITISDDVYTYTHVPKSLDGIRKEFLRVIQGFIQETIPRGDWFASLLLFLSLSFIGIPFSFYFLLNGNLYTILVLSLAIVQLFIFSFIVSIKERDLSIILSVPLAIVIAPVIFLFVLEASIRFLVGKNAGWQLFEKVSS